MIKKDNNWKLPSLQAARKPILPVVYRDYHLAAEYRNLGENRKYYIRTYGCQANERDSEQIAGILSQLGFSLATAIETADLIVLNSCAVRKSAEDKIVGEIGALKKLKREKPELVIALAGCMAQEEAMVDLVLTKHPQVDIIFGTGNIDSLPKLIADCYQNKKRVVEVYSDVAEVVEGLPMKRASSHKAWINITYGCDKFCTYCIVPYTRGSQRSRQANEILKEIHDCLANDYQEITLLGQNVNAYGKDINYAGGFAHLLAEVAKSGIRRVRFVTSHPWDFNDDMLQTMVKYENIMPYLHLPLQSGDNEILRKMARRYTIESYLALYDRLKVALPHLACSTDIIVGFPGENEAQFLNTIKAVEYCKFDNIYSFIYSPRENTPASLMVDDVELAVKKERLKRLNNTFKPLALEKAKAYINQKVEVLVDGFSKRNNTVYSGYTPTNKLVNFTAATDLKGGQLVSVLIDKAKTFTLEGQQCSEK